ncbi:type IX secretion system protein PorQ [uncultured Dokdonia sp.]|uniref:type IX secretion system protein PorQ n=1 Tax=uncultured Dokdonia sp. TaxID=575653 RepID=UPI0026254542|nr:type IX secretion system protein PorQ [uncultured Dokdonia sp.]
MQKYLFLVLFLIATFCHAQLGGRATYQFLNLTTSPRQAALGGKVITNYDYDPDSGLYNPATINYRMDNQLSVNYVNYLADINYGTASYAYLWDRRTQVIHAGITYINYGTFDGRDENGNPTGDFGGGEAALSIGYATNIPYTDFHVGANVKLITSKLEQYSSAGVAVDLGFIYNYEKWDLNVAAVVRNLGTQITPYVDTIEKLPLEIDAGISQIVPNVPIRWHLTFENLQLWNIAFENEARGITDLDGNTTGEEIGFLDNVIRHTIVGVELFPRSGFNIRLGYNFRRSEELRIIDQRSFAGISAGIGIKINKIRFNYAYARFNSAAASSLFGLNIDLQ